MRARGESNGEDESGFNGVWWSERERERVCVCVDVRNREVETRCDELISKQDENERRETDGERANARRNGEREPVY